MESWPISIRVDLRCGLDVVTSTCMGGPDRTSISSSSPKIRKTSQSNNYAHMAWVSSLRATCRTVSGTSQLAQFELWKIGVRRLKPIANAEADVKATDEKLNPRGRPHWLPGFSMERVKLPPVVDGKPVSDTVSIRHLLRRTANYIANGPRTLRRVPCSFPELQHIARIACSSIGAQVPRQGLVWS